MAKHLYRILAATAFMTFMQASHASPEIKKDRAKPTMIVGYNSVPPDSIQERGEPVGAANHLIRDIAAAMDINVKFEHMPLSRLQEGIKNNTIDCISNIGGKAVVEGGVLAGFPLYRSTPGIAVSKKEKWPTTVSKNDLMGKIIGTKLKMSRTATIAQLPPAQIQEIGGELALTHNLRMLARGRVHAVYSPRIGELVYFAQKEGLSNDVQFIKLPDEPWAVYTMFSKHGAAKFKRSFDEHLQKILAERGYSYYLDRFFEKELGSLANTDNLRSFIIH